MRTSDPNTQTARPGKRVRTYEFVGPSPVLPGVAGESYAQLRERQEQAEAEASRAVQLALPLSEGEV